MTISPTPVAAPAAASSAIPSPPTVVIGGGAVADAIRAATRLVDKGRKVVVFHDFPAPSATRFPSGVEKIFRTEEETMTLGDIAAIYDAARIIDLDEAERQS